MRDQVLEKLNQIEKDNDVRLLWAIESGSRAWGFESADSDYDVRFVYIHKQDWYLSIQEKRDVIELPIEGDLDINGWDIRKALKLLQNSNPPLLEWLGSPIIYKKDDEFITQINSIKDEAYDKKSCMHHYLNMARNNFKSYLGGEKVKGKKYFYVLRLIFACKWILNHDSAPPTEFNNLLDSELEDIKFRTVIDDMLEKKKNAEESDEIDRIPELHDFIEKSLGSLLKEVDKMEREEKIATEKLDIIFRNLL